ncbi:MAG: bifunctional sugar-1-phosphate nucleotidylyltransferase/acetyltransferase [Metallosphaera sp.]|uniref:bifunctional sugar-1-phosphate nucleotidylyltransferase/acetyltransferase n=1 Tax=Metallosphaera sp. TaxID=2020860 RepID=UPI00316102F5
MKVVLLAAGKGERLEPITDTRPKPFIPILGETLIERTLRFVRELLQNPDIYVIIPDQLEKSYEAFFYKLNNVRFVKQGERKGTGGALFYVPKFSDDILIIYGDIYTTKESIEAVITQEESAILGAEVPNPGEYGSLMIDEGGYLRGIIEKSQSPPSNLINGGIFKVTPDFFEFVDKLQISSRGEYELTDALTNFSRRNKVKVVRTSAVWKDVGRPWDIIEVNKTELNGIHGSVMGDIESNVMIKGEVVIEGGSIVRHGSVIEGPVYIGKNSSIGPNAYIRPYTVIGSNSKIGSFVEVKESVIMENTKIPHLSYVGDSVIAEDVNFGAGTLIANLRFDERDIYVNIKEKRLNSGRKKLGAIIGAHVRTGINVSILPGVKIGSYARIYPGAVVNRDVRRGEFFGLR